MLRLRELRTEIGKTQAEMADILQISRQVYANYENKINEPSLEMLEKIADFFECSIDYLLGHSDDFGNVTVNKKSPSSVTPEEQKLLDDFRSLPREERSQASEYVHFLAHRRGAQNKNA